MKPWQAWVQPKGSLEFDRSNPLTRGLLFVQVGRHAIDAGKSMPPLEVAEGLNPSTVGVSFKGGDGINAEWVRKTNAFSAIPVTYASNSTRTALAADDKYTLFQIRKTEATSASSGGVATVPYADGAWTAPFAMLCIRRNGGSDGFQVINNYSGSWQALNFTVSNPPFIDTSWHSVAFTRNGGSFASYKNGQPGSTVSGNAGAPTTSAVTNVEVHVGATGNGAEVTRGKMAFTAIWNRDLSADEIRALDADPYQLLRPAVRMPTFAPAAVGGQSLSGTPSLPAVTATGSLAVQRNLSGTPSLPAATATGATAVQRNLSGTPNLPAVTATGSAAVQRDLSGTPNLPAVTASGAVEVQRNLSGTPSLPAITGAGALSTAANPDLTGTPSLPAITATGALAVQHDLSGTPNLPSLTSTGQIATGTISAVATMAGVATVTVFGEIKTTDAAATMAGVAALAGVGATTKTITGAKLNRYGNMPIGYIRGDRVYPTPGFERWLAELLSRSGGVDID